LEYIAENDVDLAFISTHLYPTDFTYKDPLTRDIMYETLSQARLTVGDRKLFYTEYNDGLFPYQLHDVPYASAFAMYNIITLQGIPDILSWWTFSDIFEEGGFNSSIFIQPGYGLMTIYDIPKPAWRSFQLLHEAGNTLIPLSIEEEHPTVGVAVTSNSTHVTTLIYNHNIPDAPIQTETVCVSFQGLSNVFSIGKSASVRRVDDSHCNPRPVWDSMGSPTYPTRQQIDTLKQASLFQTEQVAIQVVSASQIYFTIDIPPQGVASVVFPISQ